MINNYCKHFREVNNLTLLEIINMAGSDCKVGTLSAFELGHSSNIAHLTIYIKASKKMGNTFEFTNNLVYEVLNNGE